MIKETKKVPKLRFREFSGEWQEKKLEDFIEVIAMGPFGSNLKVEMFKPAGVPVIRGANLLGSYVAGNFVYVSEEKADSLGKSVAYPGDFIVTHRGTLGQVSVVPLEPYRRYITSQSQLRFKINNRKICDKWLLQYLRSHRGQHRLLVNAGQVGVPAISLPTASIRLVQINLPEKNEQKKIAEFLTVVDEKIEKLQKKKELLEKYKKGSMQAIFSQKIRFKDESGKDYPNWVEKGLGKILSITTGRKDVNAGNPKGEYPFYTCAREHTFSDEYSFDGEAILIAGNAEVGLCQYYKGKFEAYQRTYVLQNFHANGDYLFKYLSHYFRQYALGLKQTGAMSFIKIGMLDNFNVPLPVDEEQQRIADFLTSLDDKINLAEKVLEQAKQCKKALLQQMFV